MELASWDFFNKETWFSWVSTCVHQTLQHIKLVFTTGQLCSFRSPFLFWTKWRGFCFLRTDFYSNKIWATLDEPKLFINLVRFERRYRTKIDLTKFSAEDLKLR